MKGRCSNTVFDALTCQWRTFNHVNYLDTGKCYKIITCDPLDDTIDIFANLCTGVAANQSKIDYDTDMYKEFYKTMVYVFSYERQLYSSLLEE